MIECRGAHVHMLQMYASPNVAPKCHIRDRKCMEVLAKWEARRGNLEPKVCVGAAESAQTIGDKGTGPGWPVAKHFSRRA